MAAPVLPATPHLAAVRAGRWPVDRVLAGKDLRAAWATASCLYKVPPAAVAFPSTPAGLRKMLAEARDRGWSVTARGGGSGLVGNALGRGLVIDCRATLARVVAIDDAARTATVEPGCFIGELNEALAPHGLFFPVEPSSAAYATVGGAIANNAGGPRSVKYGSAVHWLAGAEGFFADGTPFQWSESGGLKAPARWRKRLGVLRDRLRGALPGLDLPAVPKIASGYRLEMLTDENLAQADLRGLLPLLAGSEGTLALFSRLTVRLAPLPRARRTAMLVMGSLDAAAHAVPLLLVHRVSALELLDETAIRMAVEYDPGLRRQFTGNEAAVLLLEAEGRSGTEAEDRLRDAVAELAGAGMRPRLEIATSAEKAEALWTLRKITSPIVHAGCGGRLGLRFIEDGVVPPPRVPEFIRGVKSLCKKQATAAVFFGHIGSGNIHINPFLDPHSRADRERLEFIYDGFTDLVLSLGGAPSGEHGDGRLRTRRWNCARPALAALHDEIKDAFDPAGALNPGVKAGTRLAPFASLKYRVNRA